MKNKNKNTRKRRRISPRLWGLIMIAVGFLVYSLRPYQNCRFWQLGCHTGSIIAELPFLVIMIILVIVGAIKLIKN